MLYVLKQISDSSGGVCKHLLGFLMIEILFFTARFIGKYKINNLTMIILVLSYSMADLQCCFIFSSFVGTSVTFKDRFILSSPSLFLVIYDIEANS